MAVFNDPTSIPISRVDVATNVFSELYFGRSLKSYSVFSLTFRSIVRQMNILLYRVSGLYRQSDGSRRGRRHDAGGVQQPSIVAHGLLFRNAVLTATVQY